MLRVCSLQVGSGRFRFACADQLAWGSDAADVVLRCEEVLLRVLDYVDEQVCRVMAP